MGREATLKRLMDERVVAVVRERDGALLDFAADTLFEAGVRAIEVTLSVPDAPKHIARLAKRYGDEHLVGVGSVWKVEDAERALDAGAKYVVGPAFNPDVIEAAHAAGAAAMPGCFTPTEAMRATDAGADIVKVFPADVVGMAFFRAVLAPLPMLRLMPTGGVSLTNAGEWLAAGAVAVGVGSALLNKDEIAARDAAALRERAATLLASVGRGTS